MKSTIKVINMYIPNIPEFADHSDRLVLQCLITEALALGHKVSVFEGEDYAVKRSTEFEDIIDGCASTGEDWIVIRDQDNKKLGTFYLIYGNCDEDETMGLIADHSDNDFSNELYNKVSDQIEH